MTCPRYAYYKALWLPILLLLTTACISETINPASLLKIERGDLPILIVAGHGGLLPLEGAALRIAEQVKDQKFVSYADMNTAELAEEIAQAIASGYNHKEKPTIIISTIHRRYCDLNRSLELASQDPRGRAYHQAYHQAIESELVRLKKINAWALLVDIHGQAHYDTSLMLGTAGNTTISDWSKGVIWGDQGLVSTLKREGFSAQPEVLTGEQAYGGGYTVRFHGKDPAVEAWQMEHSKKIRYDMKERRHYVRVLAEVLVNALRRRAKER